MAPRILAILLLVFAINHLDRHIVAILIEPIKADLQLSDTQAGLLYGFTFALFYSVLGIPIARLADRANRSRIIVVSLMLFSVMTAACGIAASYWQLLLARVGVGVGEAGTNPPSHSMIADLYPLERRTTAMAIFALGPHVGLILAFVAGGSLAQSLGWRGALLAAGCCGLAVAAIAKLLLREPAREIPPSAQPREASILDAARSLWQHRSIRHIFAGCTIVSIPVAVLLGWLPSFLVRSHGYSVADAGLLLALTTGVIGGVGTLLSGVLADRLARRDPAIRMRCVAVACLVAIPAWATVFANFGASSMLVGVALGSALIAFHLAPSFAMVQSLAQPNHRALAAALLLFVANLVGTGFGPVIVGTLSDLLAAEHGRESLRLGLLIVLPLYLWSAYHFEAAARVIGSDLGRTPSNPAIVRDSTDPAAR